MQAQRTDRELTEDLLGEENAELRDFAWTIAGEYYREGSSYPWRGIEESGVVPAESVPEALIKLVTGFGRGTTMENTPDWLVDSGREIVITIKPADGGDE